MRPRLRTSRISDSHSLSTIGRDHPVDAEGSHLDTVFCTRAGWNYCGLDPSISSTTGKRIDHDHHDEARTSKTRPGSPMQHRSNTCTALRVRRSPASATRSQQPSCDGCGGASGGAAPAEHKAVAARASTATPGCYNPMQQQAGVSRRVRASPLPTSRNTSRSRDWGGATKRALRLKGSACGILARDLRDRVC